MHWEYIVVILALIVFVVFGFLWIKGSIDKHKANKSHAEVEDNNIHSTIE